LMWRHYKFREKLLHRSRRSLCEVKIQNESYTSKTCGSCGELNQKLGSSDTFLCPSCGYEVHRDINGARNILFRALSGN
jgi:putative transposase